MSWFNWLKKSKKVEFYTNNPMALEFYPPLPSGKDMINRLKGIKVTTGLNIKKCPGIIDYGREGFVISAWQDISIQADDKGEAIIWNMPLDVNDYTIKDSFNGMRLGEIVFFQKEVFYDHFPRSNTMKGVLKINTPWMIKVPDGYRAMLLPVWYDNEERFSVIPGILDNPISNVIAVQMYWHALGREEIIKAGTPLVKVVLIQNNAIPMAARLATKDERYAYHKMLFSKHNIYGKDAP